MTSFCFLTGRVVLSPGFLAWVFDMPSTQVHLLSDNYVRGTVSSALPKSSHLMGTKNPVKTILIFFGWLNLRELVDLFTQQLNLIFHGHYCSNWDTMNHQKEVYFLSDWKETKKNAQTLVGIQAERNESSSFLIDHVQNLTILVFGIENLFRCQEFKCSFHGATFRNHSFHLHSTGKACC